MADMEEKLGQLLSDPESMQKVLNLASGIMSAQKSSNTSEAAPGGGAPAGGGLDLSSLLASLSKKPADSAAPPASDAGGAAAAPSGGGMDLSSLMASLGGKTGGENTGGGEVPAPGGFDIAALPKLMQAFSGDTNYLKPEKVNLLKALKPYFGERRGPEIDRAVKMANLARAAQSTLGGFLRR